MAQPVVLFPTGLGYFDKDTWDTGADSDYGWMVVDDDFEPAPSTQEFVDDIVAEELGDGSYGRLNVTNRSYDAEFTPLNRVVFAMDNPDFGNVSGGEDAAYLVLFRNTGSDATASLMVAWLIDWTTDGSNFTVTLADEPVVLSGAGYVGVGL